MRLVTLSSALVMALVVSAQAADGPALPNRIVTPGAIDPTVTLDVVCNDTPRERRLAPAREMYAVLDAYHIPRARGPFYVFDRLIPLAIGGANTTANIWPQLRGEADEKDLLDAELQRRVCHGLLSQAQAQREVADNWIDAYRRYVGGVPVAAPSYAQVFPPPSLAVCIKLKWDLDNLKGGFYNSIMQYYRPEVSQLLKWKDERFYHSFDSTIHQCSLSFWSTTAGIQAEIFRLEIQHVEWLRAIAKDDQQRAIIDGSFVKKADLEKCPSDTENVENSTRKFSEVWRSTIIQVAMGNVQYYCDAFDKIRQGIDDQIAALRGCERESNESKGDLIDALSSFFSNYKTEAQKGCKLPPG